jgi:CheY-like chemotaxis protein
MRSMKSIFWFEDNADELLDYRKELEKKYDVMVGAHWDLIRQTRPYPVDLVLVDVMIHRYSFDVDTEQEVQNISFPDCDWIETGLEFLRRIREGEYQKYGFPPDVPVILATALVSYPARDQAEKLGIEAFLEKPFTIERLEMAVDRVLGSSTE